MADPIDTPEPLAVTSTEPEATEPEPAPEPAKPAPRPRAKAKPTPAAEPQADDAPPPPAPEDPLKVALRDVQTRHDDLAAKFRAEADKASKLARENATLREQVETFGRREREGAIVGRLRDALPHLSAFAVKGALAALAEEGKVDRYAADADATAKAALEVLKTVDPNLLRAPAPQGGGPSGAPPQQPQQRAKGRAPF